MNDERKIKMENLQQIINILESETAHSDFPACCASAVSKIKTLASPQEAIQPLLSFMTRQPNLNYGMPGAFVHFIETFSEEVYVDFLIACIRQQPTEYNIWMLRRIMNTWESPRQEEYVSVMKAALSHANITDSLKETLSDDLRDFAE